MTFDGLTLLQQRAGKILAEALSHHRRAITEAVELDHEEMFKEPSVVARTLRELESLEKSIVDAREEFLKIESYWLATPWGLSGISSDPRPLPPADEKCGKTSEDVRAVFADSFGNTIALKSGAVLGKKRTKEEWGKAFEDAIAQGKAAKLRNEEQKVKPGTHERTVGCAERDIDPGELHESEYTRADKLLEKVFSPRVSGPNEAHDPALLDAKRVTNLSIDQDVRTQETIGQAQVDFVIGGPPVLWLTANDGTKVVILQKDFARIGEIISGMNPA